MGTQKYLTLKTFHNPIGGFASPTKLIIDNLMGRFDQYISKDISIKSYIDGNNYVFKLSIPSEKNYKYKTNIFYDVIIEFYPVDKKQEENKKIDEYGIRIFSNNPQTMFVFTNVWSKIDALYKKVPKSLYSEQALKEPTNITNPRKFVGIDKSVFYSFRKIYEICKYNKEKIEKLAIKLPEDKDFKFPGDLFNDIMSQNDKLSEIQNVEKIRLETIKKKKASDRTSNLVINGKVVASEEYKKGKNTLQSNFETNLKNAKTIQETNRLKSTSSNKLKSNLKK